VRASVSSCARVLSQMKSIRCVVYPWPAMTPSYHLSTMHSQVSSAEACCAVATTSGVQTHFEQRAQIPAMSQRAIRTLGGCATCATLRVAHIDSAKRERPSDFIRPCPCSFLWPSPPAPSRLSCPVACPRSCGAPNRPAVRGSAGWLPVACRGRNRPHHPGRPSPLHQDEETAVAERSRWRRGGGPVWLGTGPRARVER
jgi:hypothetical protein